MTNLTDRRDQRIPKLTAWQKRRAAITCADIALDQDAVDDLPLILMQLGLKPSPKPRHERRNEYGRAK